MEATLEREPKLRAGPGFAGVTLPGTPIADRVLTSVYYDTDDLRLVGAGITLRRRVEGRGAEWQLKLPRADGRLELAWEAQDDHVPTRSRSCWSRTPAGAAFRASPCCERTAPASSSPMTAWTSPRSSRTGWTFLDDDESVLRSFDEIEVELVEGDAKALQRIEKHLRKAGATAAKDGPKLLRALDVPPPSHSRKATDPPTLVATVLQEQYRRLLRHDPATRLGTDPEDLHQMRVATRKLRAVLRAARPMLDRPWADGLRDPLKRVGGVRDLDVILTRLQLDTDRLDAPERFGARALLERLRERRDSQQAALVVELSRTWYVSLLTRLDTAVAAPAFVACDQSLADRATREHGRARRLVRGLGDEPTDAPLHEVRKAVKRARYASELASLTGAPGAKRYVSAAKDVQDVLGDHQDAVTAQAMLRDLAETAPTTGEKLAAQALVELQDVHKDAARARFPKLWRKLDKRARALS